MDAVKAAAPGRRYVKVGSRMVHVRIAGQGPALLLLHDAPGSSAQLTPLLARLAPRMRVYAPDAPGHGLSDALPGAPGVQDYIDAALDTAAALGLDRFAVAGWGIGGLIAEALAAAAPDRVTCVLADSPHTGGTEADAALLDRAFPRFTPRADGTHLLAAWHAIRRTYVFDPWFAVAAEARRRGAIPDARRLHQQLLDVLRPGDRYADMARAFAVPAIPRWDDGDAWADRITDAVASLDLPSAPDLPPQPRPTSPRIVRSYVSTPFGQLHLRSAGSGGPPLVVIHSSPGYAAALEPLVEAFAADRTVLAFDTLGNGDSDRPQIDDTDIAFYAAVLAAALDSLGVDAVDVWGSHTGALIGIELAITFPGRVRRLGLEGVPLFTPDETADLLANYLPPMEPDDAGAHLLRAWNMRADMALFWPWYRRTPATAKATGMPTPEALHALTMELLVTGETWRTAYGAAFAYPTRERLPLLAAPALIATSPNDTLAPFTAVAASLAQRAITGTSHGTATAAAQRQTAAVYSDFFSGA